MILNTASATISFIRELEEQAAAFYTELAGKFPEAGDVLGAFAAENKKYIKQVQRAYQSVITDAIEGCFAFEMETDDYVPDTDLSGVSSLSEATAKAIKLERVMLKCYDTAAEQSMSLLADVPRNFKMVSKKRLPRLEKLKALG